MLTIVQGYFRDERGEWHQPGNRQEFAEEEALRYSRRGLVTIIETAMLQQPETRVVNFGRVRRKGAL